MRQYTKIIGIGGIGTGIIFHSSENHTLGRNESRLALLTDAKDYCKQHIILHYITRLSGRVVKVYPVGKVGDDSQGESLLQMMAASGMDTSNVLKQKKSNTMFSVCLQYPDKSGCNITSQNSACDYVDEKFCSPIIARLADQQAICIIAPEIPLETRISVIKQAKERKAFIAFSASSAEIRLLNDQNIYSLCDLVAINEDEAAALLGKSCMRDEDLVMSCVEKLAPINPEIMLCITFGKKGCYSYHKETLQFRKPFPPLRVENTAGAGDAFLGGVISGLVLGLPFHAEGEFSSAVSLGSVLATLSVESAQSIVEEITWEEINRRCDNKYSFAMDS